MAATGGSSHHYLSIDTGLRPVVASLLGTSVPTSVYLTGDDFDENNQARASAKKLLATALDEAFLLDFTGDLYDELIEISFHVRLRGQQRFDELRGLIEQIERDVTAVRTAFRGRELIGYGVAPVTSADGTLANAASRYIAGFTTWAQLTLIS